MQKKMRIPGADRKPDGTTHFRLGASGQRVDVWLTGRTARNVYFQEHLPACFERALEFDRLNLRGAALEWIFTGARGGFAVRVSKNSVETVQCYYDSFGLSALSALGKADASASLEQWFATSMAQIMKGTEGLGTYPRKEWVRTKADFRGPVRSLTLSLDHKLALTVRVNGALKINQLCLIDVSRHQMRVSDPKADVQGRLIKPQPVPVEVNVDTQRRRQTMIGFGGVTIPTAYAELSAHGRRRWWELVMEYNLLIQRENPMGPGLRRDMSNWDRLDQASPHYYGDNFPNGNVSDFAYNRVLRRLGGQVWFEFWQLPDWAVKTGEYLDEKNRKRHGLVDVRQYVRAMVGYCLEAKRRTGAPPEVVGIQNELSQPVATYHAMTQALRVSLNRAGFAGVKIHMSDANMLSPDSTWGRQYADGITRARTFTADPKVWDAIDYATTHMYDYQEYFNDPDAFDAPLREFHRLTAGKPFLSTELCVNNPRFQKPCYRLALLMGELYHKNLVLADAAALLYCWSLVNVTQPSFGWTRALFVPDESQGFVPAPSSHQLRVFGAYSRRIRKGMTRVEVRASDPDLLTTAFAGRGRERTVVMLNRSTHPVTVTLHGVGKMPEMERCDPYHENECVSAPAKIRIEPGAVVTLTNVPRQRLPDHFTVSSYA
ncbi:MAG: hypothetical protein PHR35_12485 [Kiritimatiellae bacterium]|nr:hypothetical protein [Kiritimatiellia bacterium]